MSVMLGTAQRSDEQTRAKIVSVSREDIIETFQMISFPRGYIVPVPRFTIDIPDGFSVREVYDDPQTNSLCFVITHPSFDPVAPGCEIPRMHSDVMISQRNVTLD